MTLHNFAHALKTWNVWNAPRPPVDVCSSWTWSSPMPLSSQGQGKFSRDSSLRLPLVAFGSFRFLSHVFVHSCSFVVTFVVPLLHLFVAISFSPFSSTFPSALVFCFAGLGITSKGRAKAAASSGWKHETNVTGVTLRYFESTLCTPVNEFGTPWHWLSKFCLCVSVSFKSLAKEAREETCKCQPTKNWGRRSIHLDRTIVNFSPGGPNIFLTWMVRRIVSPSIHVPSQVERSELEDSTVDSVLKSTFLKSFWRIFTFVHVSTCLDFALCHSLQKAHSSLVEAPTDVYFLVLCLSWTHPLSFPWPLLFHRTYGAYCSFSRNLWA